MEQVSLDLDAKLMLEMSEVNERKRSQVRNVMDFIEHKQVFKVELLLRTFTVRRNYSNAKTMLHPSLYFFNGEWYLQFYDDEDGYNNVRDFPISAITKIF